MSKSSPNAKAEFVEHKRKLLYWIAQWTDELEDFDNINLDVPQLTLMLQSMGFRLESYTKEFEPEATSLNVADRHVVQIELRCVTSGMKGSLVRHKKSCSCPTEEEANSSQFWTVMGSAPSSRESISMSNSSLVPTISPAKSKIINALLAKVLMIINTKDALEKVEDLTPTENKSLTRHRSLDTLKAADTSQLLPRLLKRGPSWEVDPRTSPPTRTSSPVPVLCNSLSQISLNSGNASSLVKNLESIKKLVDETLDLASGSNATFVKNIPTKRVSDIQPAGGSCSSDLSHISISSTTPQREQRSAKRKLLTPKKSKENKVATAERRNLISSSRIGMLRKKVLAPGVSPLSPRSPQPNILKPRIPLSRQTVAGSGGAAGIFRSKIGGIKKTPASKVAKDNEAGPSGITRLRSSGSIPTPVKKRL